MLLLYFAQLIPSWSSSPSHSPSSPVGFGIWLNMYLRPLVADVALVAKCHLSALSNHEKGKLFSQLVDLLQFYETFEIDDHDGTRLTDDELIQAHYDRFEIALRKFQS